MAAPETVCAPPPPSCPYLPYHVPRSFPPIYPRWRQRLGYTACVESEEFYVDDGCQQMFRTYVSKVVERVNSITGGGQ